MQTLIKMDKVVIEDYYRVTIMDENMNWMKLTHLLSLFSLNPRAPFCTSTFIWTFLITLLNVHTRENTTSPLCILCMLLPQIIPFLMHSH